MKLLFLTEFYPKDDKLVFSGGVEARVYYLVKRAKKDFRVQVISSASQHIPATSLSIFSRLWFMAKSFYLALISDFDLVEGSNVVSYLPAFLAAKLKAKPAVAWIPDILGKHWWEFGPVVGFFGRLVENICLRLPWDKIIALSGSTSQKLINRGVELKKITVIHAGINPQEFQFEQPKKFSQLTIVCVARLVRTKRIDQLIKAVASLKPSPKLIIVGFGPQEERLNNLAQGRAKFLKSLPRNELIQLLSRSHLFCLPSVVEGFGIATIEAMACGLPSVLADIPVNREITKNGQGAILFRANDVVDLSRKLKLLLTDKQLYQQKQGEALALSKSYSWETIYRQTKAVYETYLYH